MSTPKLPLEIIDRIASFVPRDDMPKYTLVCKAWKDIFEIAMMTKVSITLAKRSEFTWIFYDLFRSQKNYEKGRYAKELTLDPLLSLREKNYGAIQKNLPNIKYLNMGILNPVPLMDSEIFKWNAWPNLRELQAIFDISYLQNKPKVVLATLKQLSGLRRLKLHARTIDKNAFLDQFSTIYSGDLFSAEDMEALHEYLPKLQYLNININFAKDCDGISIDRISPATDMDEFIATISNVSPSWLCYFAQKYRNLRILKLGSSSPTKVSLEYTDPFTERNMSILFRPTSTCTKLLLLCIHEDEDERKRYTQPAIYWNALSSSRQKACFIKYNPLFSSQSIYDYTRDVILPLRLCASKIENLVIQVKTAYIAPSPIIETLTICPHLRDLDIKCDEKDVELDTILDICTKLETLIIECGSVILRKPKSIDSPKHILLTLSMIKVEIEADVLSYISYRCRGLHYMKLYNVGVKRSFFPYTGEFCVSMPHTHFRELWLYGLQFYYSDSINGNQNINFVLIPKHTQEIQSRTTVSTSTPMSAFEYSMDASEYYWRNICSRIKCLKFPEYYVREMKDDEIKRASQTFNRLQSEDSKDKLESKNRETDQRVYGWEHDLYKGYVLFKCGSVKTLTYKGLLTNPPPWFL
ncbi:hypothetical protein PHYBLDRAFT_138268 [Phycomyces blakesleeanus NRRL 1555(-)]|uniref:F-box domain-containing protein n=2 Tax=Phycomyces blakesleeanus TaxID=4837 RepID=A0A162V7Z3_PHYB8|nr:hypothetical protein PHYBLDRAFT_138268 [Phycomyces blakesleeanus NRRL 1555(-)]OAD80723.1 hypothetical protein PHYBLDRAFT_138268 [Phycomyces blakesleeanus NRRL 1555(-)]|eukprot:XP_018298763.1 hypothetical protein PHYBLDRAFT_138268 [Phycomyces blakesleeanus NRRL 1555(-)]